MADIEQEQTITEEVEEIPVDVETLTTAVDTEEVSRKVTDKLADNLVYVAIFILIWLTLLVVGIIGNVKTLQKYHKYIGVIGILITIFCPPLGALIGIGGFTKSGQ